MAMLVPDGNSCSWEPWDHSVWFFSAVSTQKFIREIEKKRRLDGTAADARSIYTCKLEVVTRVRKCWSGYRGSNNIAPEPA